MAKQKLKNTRKSADPARPVGAEPDMADRRAAIKGVSKRKNRPDRNEPSPQAEPPGGRPGKGKVKARKAALPAGRGGGALAGGPSAKKAVRNLLAKVARRPVRLPALERLEIAIDEVRHGARASPRTRKLQMSGTPKMAQKVIEEAGEVAIEAIQGNRPALVAESVDLLYNLVVLLSASGVSLSTLWAEMDRREVALGMAEKLPKVVDPEG